MHIQHTPAHTTNAHTYTHTPHTHMNTHTHKPSKIDRKGKMFCVIMFCEKEICAASAKEPHIPAKKPYISTKELCVSAKEPCISVQEPCISVKESCTSANKSCTSTREPCTSAKEPCTAQGWNIRTLISHEPLVCSKTCFSKTKPVP